MLLVVIGKRGMGKTTLGAWIVQDKTRLLVVDTLSTLHGGVVITGPTWRDALANIKSPRFRVLLRELPEDDFGDVFDLALQLRDVCVFVDEVDFWIAQLKMPDQFRAVVRYGRHYNVDLVIVARRPADVPRLVTSQADRIISFKMTEPRDIEWLRDAVGGTAEAVRSLDPFEFLSFDLTGDSTHRAKLSLTGVRAEYKILETLGEPMPDQAHHPDQPDQLHQGE